MQDQQENVSSAPQVFPCATAVHIEAPSPRPTLCRHCVILNVSAHFWGLLGPCVGQTVRGRFPLTAEAGTLQACTAACKEGTCTDPC